MARRERFSQPPRVLSPQYKGQIDKRMTAFDHQRIAMERLKMEESARIKNEYELHSELFNFNHLTEVDEYGFPLRTPYQIPDSVPSVYVPPTLEKEEKNQNSVSPSDSEKNRTDGTE